MITSRILDGVIVSTLVQNPRDFGSLLALGANNSDCYPPLCYWCRGQDPIQAVCCMVVYMCVIVSIKQLVNVNHLKLHSPMTFKSLHIYHIA